MGIILKGGKGFEFHVSNFHETLYKCLVQSFKRKKKFHKTSENSEKAIYFKKNPSFPKKFKK